MVVASWLHIVFFSRSVYIFCRWWRVDRTSTRHRL